MNEERKQQIIDEVEYFILTSGATVRSTAKEFCLSKTTVYVDLTKYCSQIYGNKSHKMQLVSEKLKANLLIRHIHGGEATRQKYLKMKK